MEEQDRKLRLPTLRSTTPVEEKSHSPYSISNFELASFKYNCSCHICHDQSISNPHSYFTVSQPSPKTKKNLKGFSWLLEKLSDISNECSIRINTPDVVIFKFGRPALYVQTTREKLLKANKSAERLKIQEVIKSISNISRTRKREEILNNKIMLSVNPMESGKEIACLRYMASNTTNDIEEFSCYDEDGALKIMNENDFMGLLWQRPSSNLWRTIAYIQSLLKCKNGVGESFIHKYHFDEFPKLLDPESDFSDSSEFDLFLQSPSKYSELIFLRLYFYLNKHLNIKLKSIQGEFVKDENNKIWLVHASLIDFTGKIAEKSPIRQPLTESVQILPETEVKEDLIYHLEQVSKEPKNPRTEKLSNYMKEECEKIMKATRFVDFFSNARVDHTSVKAYEKLRPSTGMFKRPTYVKGKSTVKRSETEQKKLLLSRGSEIDTKSSSPVKNRQTWIYMPKLKFSPIKDQKKTAYSTSKSPISSTKFL